MMGVDENMSEEVKGLYREIEAAYSRVQRDYADYLENLPEELKEGEAPHPHCDELICHRPLTCWACDLYPNRQALREEMKINFSDEDREGYRPCPSEMIRPCETVNLWPNNRAEKAHPDDYVDAVYGDGA